MDLTPAEILVSIISQYMNLSTDQIWQYNSLKQLPPNNTLFVVVHYVASKPPLCNNSSFYVDTNVVPNVGYETIEKQSEEYYRIEIASSDTQAQLRKDEIVMALEWAYSQYLQTKYSCRIFPMSDAINNVSRQDGAAMLNRFMVDVKVLSWQSITKVVDYYDSFPYSLNSNS